MLRQNRLIIMTKLGLRNILLNWRHSLATMMAIAAGFIAVALFDGFMKNMSDMVYESYIKKGVMGHVLLEKVGGKENYLEDPWTYSLDKGEQDFVLEFIKKDPRVNAYVRFLILTGLISNGNVGAVFFGVGYDAHEATKFRGDKWSWNTVAGIPLHKAPDENVILLGTNLAKRLDCTFQDGAFVTPEGGLIPEDRPFTCANPMMQLSVTTEHSQVNALTLKPAGITDLQLREVNERYVALPLSIAQKLSDTDRITRYSVLLNETSLTPAFIADFNSNAQKAGRNLVATEWINHPGAATGKGGLEILGIFRTLFLTVVSIISAMAVANTMMKSINERVREVGTLRSFGFRQSDIVLLFSAEGFFLSALACAAGFIAAAALSAAITHSGFTFKAGILSTPIPLKITMVPLTWATGILTLSAISFGTSWIVSRKVSKAIVADLLRHVA